MKNIFLSLISCVFFLFSLESFAQGETFLADRHAQKGVNCVACHTETPPQQAVPTEKCQSCHGDFEAMKEKTKNLSPNPHYTHMGDQPCGECHNAHKPSVNMCGQCHKINMNVK